jgi:hypothetical protein
VNGQKITFVVSSTGREDVSVTLIASYPDIVDKAVEYIGLYCEFEILNSELVRINNLQREI